jgi:hypothetical protein
VYTGVCGIGTCLANASTATTSASSSAVASVVEGNKDVRVYVDVHGIDLNAVDNDEVLATQDVDHDLEKVTNFVLTIID